MVLVALSASALTVHLVAVSVRRVDSNFGIRPTGHDLWCAGKTGVLPTHQTKLPRVLFCLLGQTWLTGYAEGEPCRVS